MKGSSGLKSLLHNLCLGIQVLKRPLLYQTRHQEEPLGLGHACADISAAVPDYRRVHQHLQTSDASNGGRSHVQCKMLMEHCCKRLAQNMSCFVTGNCNVTGLLSDTGSYNTRFSILQSLTMSTWQCTSRTMTVVCASKRSTSKRTSKLMLILS